MTATGASPLDGLIPPDKRGAVELALRSVRPGVELDAAERITGGASGAGVFRLRAGGETLLLRIEKGRDALNDPARQYICMRIAAAAGVAPAVLHADAEAGVALTAFIEAAPAEALDSGARLALLAEAIRRLHAAPLFPPLMPYLDAMDSLAAGLAASGALPAEAGARVQEAYATVSAAYRKLDADVVSSHNDLNRANVVFTADRAFVVDWETAFAADRYVDLAAAANFFTLDDAGELALASAYFGETPSPYRQGRLYLMRQINRVFYGVMLLQAFSGGRKLEDGDLDVPPLPEILRQLGAERGPQGFVRLAMRFLLDAVEGARGPRLQAALDAVGLA